MSKGKLVNLKISVYGLSDIYLINSAEHIISCNKEIVKINIEKRKTN